jgi:hypothetical protein
MKPAEIKKGIELKKEEAQKLAAVSKKVTGVETQTGLENAQLMYKDMTRFVKNVSTLRLNYTRILDAEKKSAMALEKDVTQPVTLELERVKKLMYDYETKKLKERQEIERKAAEEAAKIRNNRSALVNRLLELSNTLDGTNLESITQKIKGYKPKSGIYGSDGQEWFEVTVSEWLEKFKAIDKQVKQGKSDAKAKAAIDAQQAQMKAHFDATIKQQAATQTGPEKSKGTSFKRVLSTKNDSAYQILLENFLKTGGSRDKLEFLLRWAEKSGLSHDLLHEEKVPVIRAV